MAATLLGILDSDVRHGGALAVGLQPRVGSQEAPQSSRGSGIRTVTVGRAPSPGRRGAGRPHHGRCDV